MPGKNTICLWYDGTALDAAQFYAATFPDSAVGAVAADWCHAVISSGSSNANCRPQKRKFAYHSAH